VPSGSVTTEALSIGELKRMTIFHIAMKDATGKQIAVTSKAFFDADYAPVDHFQSKSGKKSTFC